MVTIGLYFGCQPLIDNDYLPGCAGAGCAGCAGAGCAGCAGAGCAGCAGAGASAGFFSSAFLQPIAIVKAMARTNESTIAKIFFTFAHLLSKVLF
jgi:hypothetical protein